MRSHQDVASHADLGQTDSRGQEVLEEAKGAYLSSCSAC
jgi:hypothetical protein